MHTKRIVQFTAIRGKYLRYNSIHFLSTLYIFRVLITSPCIICKINLSHVRQIIFQWEMRLNIDTIRANSFSKLFSHGLLLHNSKDWCHLTAYAIFFLNKLSDKLWKDALSAREKLYWHSLNLFIKILKEYVWASGFSNVPISFRSSANLSYRYQNISIPSDCFQ